MKKILNFNPVFVLTVGHVIRLNNMDEKVKKNLKTLCSNKPIDVSIKLLTTASHGNHSLEEAKYLAEIGTYVLK